uniref:Major facilitator superfamily (MFS) profile domain-containing protein n=1 Tax=Romanomermis culicivorax TaxID=13658 RepID=A0A915I703_ROMCU
MAEGNRRKFPLDLVQNLETESQKAKNYTIFDLFKTTRVRQRMLIMPNAAMCYYGLSMNPTLLGGDKYFTFILAGFIEISAIFIVLFLVDRVGRKIMVFSGFFLTACVMSATFFVSENKKIVLIGMVITGKLTTKAAYNTLYLYTPELFPTLIRSTAVGLCSMVARFGATIASFLAMWLDKKKR